MSAKNPRVALVSGHWGQNIGNAFFNLGGKWILEQVYGSDEVAFIQDQPGYRTFHDASKGNPENDLGLLQHLDIDVIVLQGPVLTEHIAQLWGPTLDRLMARGTQVVLLGAAFFKFREAELAAVRGFLGRYRPAAISTRDPRSFAILDSWGLDVPLFDGLDSAFFAPKAYAPPALSDFNYYAFNFDRYPEQTIRLSPEGHASPDRGFIYDGVHWDLSTPQITSKLAHRSKVQAYVGHAIDRRKLPATLNGKTVVRPEHRVNPHIGYKIYQHSNAVASDEPWTYLTVYANAQLTLADRVHACVATLAYGGSAMLFTPSPRAALFDRIGATDIRRKPTSVGLDVLEAEREKQVAWLSSNLQA